MALITNKKKEIIILLAMLAIFMFLFGFVYAQPANQLLKCISRDFNVSNSELKMESNFKWWYLLAIFMEIYYTVWGTTFIIDVVHAYRGSTRDDFIRNFTLIFIFLTGLFTLTTCQWVLDFTKDSVNLKTEIDGFVGSNNSTIAAQFSNELCVSINNRYVFLKFVPPYLPAIYTFWMCFSALYVFHRLSKTTGYPSIDAANRKLINFVHDFTLLAIVYTVGKTAVQKEVDFVCLLAGFMIGILFAFAAIAALVWCEGPGRTETPTQLRFLKETIILHGGRQITLRLFEKPNPIFGQIPNAN